MWAFPAGVSARLAPAVWICAPVTAAVLLLVGLSWPTDAVTRLVRTALFAPYSPWVDSVYWTLGIEIAFYAVVWTLLWLGRFHLMEVVAHRDRHGQHALLVPVLSARLVGVCRDALVSPAVGASRMLLCDGRDDLADAIQGGDAVPSCPLRAVFWPAASCRSPVRSMFTR